MVAGRRAVGGRPGQLLTLLVSPGYGVGRAAAIAVQLDDDDWEQALAMALTTNGAIRIRAGAVRHLHLRDGRYR